MYERCLSEAERVLASSSKVTLPVKDLWNQVRIRCKAVSTESPTLADFSAMLEADPRFELMQTQTESPDIPEEAMEDEGELGSLGVHPEDLVKLRRIRIVRDEGEEDESPGTRVRGLSTTSPVASHPARPQTTSRNSRPTAPRRKRTPASRTRKSPPKRTKSSSARTKKR